jgi:predicted nucleotidyltransferase
MMNTIQHMVRDKVATPPEWVATNVQLLVVGGSHACGTHYAHSDIDLYGFCIPPKSILFPHTAGYIDGFCDQPQRFEQWTQQDIKYDGDRHDATVYGIVKFLNLLIDANPNIVEVLFSPQRCIRHITAVGQMVWDARHSFLSKQMIPKFRGYAFSHIKDFTKSGMDDRTRSVCAIERIHGIANDTRFSLVQSELYRRVHDTEQFTSDSLMNLSDQELRHYHDAYKVMMQNGKRAESIKRHGYDVKALMNVVRLVYEIKQIFQDGTIVMDQHSEELRAIRDGSWQPESIDQWFGEQTREIDKLADSSKLPDRCSVRDARKLLIDCIEHHYGSIDHLRRTSGESEIALRDISVILKRVGIS